jgi:hypothetical protein
MRIWLRYPENPLLRLLSQLSFLLVLVSASALGTQSSPDVNRISPPVVIHQFHILHEAVLLPDGKLFAVAIRYRDGRQVITGQTSSDDGRIWTTAHDLVALPRSGGIYGYYKTFVDREGEIHIFLLADSDTGAALPIKEEGGDSAREQILDIWQVKTQKAGSVWEPAERIWKGRAGDLLSVIQLKSGRIVLPICYLASRTWRDRGTGFKDFTYVGPFETSALFSDDDGDTWHESTSRLDIQTPDLSSEGAIEPIVLQLKDGRVWMLIRSQTGRFYESFSADGATWSEPRPTSIVSSDSPAGLFRLKDGRIFMLVNDCQRFPYALGGRQVLLGAISDDEGRTWHGYREVIRDPLRGVPPPPEGDFGVSYPFPTLTADGKVVFTMGVQTGTRSQVPEGPAGINQSEKRPMVLVDPRWLDARSQQTDFSQGLSDWSIFGTKGVALVRNPKSPSSVVLQISKPRADWPAGAVWNFPAGRKGLIRLRILVRHGFQGLLIGLTDEFSPPWDGEDQYDNVFNFQLGRDGKLPDGSRIIQGKWHDMELNWNCDKRICDVFIDHRKVVSVPLNRTPQSQGVCYLRLRSTASTTDPDGLLVQSVAAHVAAP